MKKLVSIIVLAATFGITAGAQSLLGGWIQSVKDNVTAQGLISNVAETLYSAPVSLNGAYKYNGAAVSVTSSEGGVVANLAGTAVTSGIEAKADEYLAKIGIVPGAASFTFNAEDNSFTMNIGSISLPGTYKVGAEEKTVTLTFGKTMQYFCMTGNLESSLSGAKMLFPANGAVSFLKKVAKQLGKSSSEVSGIAKLAEGYDNYKIGFKLAK